MVRLEEMSREELIEVIRMKDDLIRELREELDAYMVLVEELRDRLGAKGFTIPENGD
ncbi:MAG TPA: hypothetical protein GX501_07495 [Clostridiaceae bacterium]|nr:hypothetical protein [Clostridiaceae bacterium]